MKGVYNFRFTAASKLSPECVCIYMSKNEQKLIYNCGYNNHTYYEYLSNGIIIELKQGDRVYMRLPGGGNRLVDTVNSHNMFSGFLVYSM